MKMPIAMEAHKLSTGDYDYYDVWSIDVRFVWFRRWNIWLGKYFIEHFSFIDVLKSLIIYDLVSQFFL